MLEDIISFSDFVDFVIHENERQDVDAHWKPISQKCHHCAIPYDVIGRMETFDEDLKYIVLKLGLENILPIKNIKTLWKNRSDRKKYENVKDRTKKSLEYFSELEKSQVKELYDIYQIDFEMFGYDASDYLNLL